MTHKKLNTILITISALSAFAIASPVFAAKGDQGVDLSHYQTSTAEFGQASDKFAIIQLGG
ncbi:hypothetical protein AWRIB429_1928, partial [Oenococcus oeni AWRIB429]